MIASTVSPTSPATTDRRVAIRLAACVCVAGTGCVPTMRHFVAQCVQRLGLPEDLRDSACLVASELVTNAVLHSGSHSVAILVGVERHHLTVSVRDCGCWCPRTGARRSSADDGVSCGRGLDLVRALADRFSIVTGPAGTTAKVSLRLSTPLPAPQRTCR